jgi:hypothetical protein
MAYLLAGNKTQEVEANKPIIIRAKPNSFMSRKTVTVH